MSLWISGAPAEYGGWLRRLPAGATLVARRPKNLGAAHVFHVRRAALAKDLADLRLALRPAGFVWVSWPKKASKVPTDITEDVIREIALPMGFVDVKVCAVSEVWSGLKLMIRKSERPQ